MRKKKLEGIGIATPYAVLCPLHERVFLTKEQYEEQMFRPDALWRCPLCHKSSEWDDENYEQYFT